jgi:hypothetical protein
MPCQEVLLQVVNGDQTILSPSFFGGGGGGGITKREVYFTHKVPAQTSLCPKYVTVTNQKLHKFSSGWFRFNGCES